MKKYLNKIINENEPLPSHTKLRYEECYAKVFLEHYYYEEYGNLIIGDKPDLWSEEKSIGIEVTECIDQNHKKALNLWSLIPYVENTKSEKYKIEMEKCGYKYQGGTQFWGGTDYSKDVDSKVFDLLYECIKNKLKKINESNYHIFHINELFIYSEILYIDDSWNEKLLVKINNIFKKYKIKFDIVHICSQCRFNSYNLVNNTFKIINIEDTCSKLACKARNLVEEAEKK